MTFYMEDIPKTLYTVSRIRKNDDLYGSNHGSDYAEKTLCGKELDHNWFITDNKFEGLITCKECKKVLKQFPDHLDRAKDTIKHGTNKKRVS